MTWVHRKMGYHFACGDLIDGPLLPKCYRNVANILQVIDHSIRHGLQLAEGSLRYSAQW
jgi:hypothetical protein